MLPVQVFPVRESTLPNRFEQVPVLQQALQFPTPDTPYTDLGNTGQPGQPAVITARVKQDYRRPRSQSLITGQSVGGENQIVFAQPLFQVAGPVQNGHAFGPGLWLEKRPFHQGQVRGREQLIPKEDIYQRAAQVHGVFSTETD